MEGWKFFVLYWIQVFYFSFVFRKRRTNAKVLRHSVSLKMAKITIIILSNSNETAITVKVKKFLDISHEVWAFYYIAQDERLQKFYMNNI